MESLGGDTGTSLKEEEIRHHLEGTVDGDAVQSGDGAGGNNLLSHLRSKWTVEDMGGNSTRVSLSVEFAFRNPVYAALSGSAAPKVAEYMIRAFETRVREVLESNPEMVKASLADMEGSRLRR